MTTTVSDYLDIDARATSLSLTPLGDLALLPRGFDEAESPEELAHESEAATLRKLLAEEGVVINQPEFGGDHSSVHIEKSADWVAPAIYVGSQLISGDPRQISVLLEVLEYCARRALRVLPHHRARLTFVIETKKGRQYKKLTYDGPPSGLSEVAGMIRELHDGP